MTTVWGNSTFGPRGFEDSAAGLVMGGLGSLSIPLIAD
jgi:hypothetical protein